MRVAIAACAGLVLFATSAQAAPPDYSELLAELDLAGHATHAESGVRVADCNFSVGAKQVEALSFTPPAEGPFPALLLIPGYGTSARDWTANGLCFGAAGYYCLAVSQPGFGQSEGPPDFVGPDTLAALTAAWERLRTDPQVDPARLGIVGYSRGALAASLLATQLPDAKAVVLGAGIYDFKQAFADISSAMIRRNMLVETGSPDSGLSDCAAGQRSSILEMDKLSAAVLILHGDQDLNAPVSQAYLLRDKLTALGKDFELHIFAGKEHRIGLRDFQQLSLDFLGRRLAAQPSPPPAAR